MKEEIKVTRDIHNFVRGKLSYEKSLKLLEKIGSDPEWIAHLEIDLMLHQMFSNEKRKQKSVVKWY
ncbi:MAG: hypothetical protein WD512_00785 [Candidatus Paceibacterota bacterium]